MPACRWHPPVNLQRAFLHLRLFTVALSIPTLGMLARLSRSA
jgi:hypothetical protein